MNHRKTVLLAATALVTAMPANNLSVVFHRVR